MSNRLFVFDVDGTLTPSRCPMDAEFADWFRDFMQERNYVFVSGSDYDKIQQQIPDDILKNAYEVFACSGNSRWVYGQEIYRHDWKPSETLLEFLTDELVWALWPREKQHANQIEIRPGLVNFSTIGRDCSADDRRIYNRWDAKKRERERIRDRIRRHFPDLQCEIGGEISLDIYPQGCDKSQIIKHLPDMPIYFFGDGIRPGYNDYTLAQALQSPSQSFPVENWTDTWSKLQNL